ncbi:unnamed protein product [Mycena citricolor]|uniref:Uncharacterized protein n=1 Tax=Mycena citricolor TaxID=2018698 RepID=A0AAD2H707_9AGAR|nr:unnamed protein product [Mycena citricolor]
MIIGIRRRRGGSDIKHRGRKLSKVRMRGVGGNRKYSSGCMQVTDSQPSGSDSGTGGQNNHHA